MGTSFPLPDEAKLISDRHVLAVLESINDGFISLMPDWRASYVNHAAERILHKQREELLGKNIREVFPDLVGTFLWKRCYEAVDTQSIMDVEDVYPLTGHWLDVRISPSQAGLALSFHEMMPRQQRMQDRHDHNQSMYLQASLIELAYDAILVHDPQGVIGFWNRGAEHLYDWTAQEAIGKVSHQLFQTRFPKSVEALDRFLATGELWKGELIHTCKDGTHVIVESRQVAIRPPRSESVAIMEINRDVTERKQREQENQEQYRTIVHTANEGIWLIDPEGNTLFINHRMAHMLGYSVEEMIDHPVTEFIFPEDVSLVQEHIASSLQGTFEQFDFRLRCKGDHPLYVFANTSPVRDGRGRIIGSLGMLTDITERKHIQAQERFLIEVSQVLSSTLDYQEMLANMARLVVPQIADWLAIDIVDDAGHFELIELAHKDPEQVLWARTLRERYPVDPDAPLGTACVARTGQAELYTAIPDELLVAVARNEEELAITRQIGFSSVMLVPLIARGRTIGVITFVAAESGKHYNNRDLALAQEVGRRAGVALDNARLYRQVQQSRDQFDIIL